MAKSNVKIKNRISKEWRNLVKLAKKNGKIPDQIDVGLFGKNDSEVVKYATRNEFGNPSKNIPARPFLRSTLSVYKKEIIKFIMKEKENILLKGEYKKSFGRIGAFVQGLVQKRIKTSRSWAVPNRPSTIAKKGSSTPLINTGRMRQAITYSLRRKIAKNIIRSFEGM